MNPTPVTPERVASIRELRSVKWVKPSEIKRLKRATAGIKPRRFMWLAWSEKDGQIC